MLRKTGFFLMFATSLFFLPKLSSQTHITPLIGVDIIAIKGSKKSGFSSSPLYEIFHDNAIPTFAAGLDVEKKINKNFHLYYGIKYLSFTTGYRRFFTIWGPDPYFKINFQNLSQKLGALYQISPNVSIGLALNLDYVFDLKLERKQTGAPRYFQNYPNLLDLGINLHLRYMWKNWVVKVGYNYGFHDLRNTPKDTPPEKRRPIKPLNGFAAYVGYRFDL